MMGTAYVNWILLYPITVITESQILGGILISGILPMIIILNPGRSDESVLQ